MEDYTEFFGEIWTDVVSVFCFWSTGSRNRNVDFNAGESSIHGMACTFMSEYLLIILCERYFPECRVFYPPDWLVVQADWPLHGWSVFFWLLFLTGIAGYAFADAARRRIGYA